MRSFNVTESGVTASVVKDHAVHSKSLYEKNGNYFLTRTWGDIQEDNSIENIEQFQKVANELLGDIDRIKTFETIRIQRQRDTFHKRENNEAEDTLERQLQDLD